MFKVESLMFDVYRNENASLRGTKQSMKQRSIKQMDCHVVLLVPRCPPRNDDVVNFES